MLIRFTLSDLHGAMAYETVTFPMCLLTSDSGVGCLLDQSFKEAVSLSSHRARTTLHVLSRPLCLYNAESWVVCLA